MTMSTGIDAIHRTKSNPIRFIAHRHQVDYAIALNVADAFMERHGGLRNRNHLDAIEQARQQIGDRYAEFEAVIAGVMALRLTS